VNGIKEGYGFRYHSFSVGMIEDGFRILLHCAFLLRLISSKSIFFEEEKKLPLKLSYRDSHCMCVYMLFSSIHKAYKGKALKAIEHKFGVIKVE